ncbi:MAG: Gfo/Idh/MocA family oxidoreductase [Bdellovibrionales bacterium]|nr:Gfo/Idh/MocA family oxidoreductase [Bdellovibrionales bacterium]
MIKVGIVGLGVVGQKRLECLSPNPDYQVTALCDLDYEKTNCPNVKRYGHYHEFIKENLDAVFICLPNDLARDYTQIALERNLHVFCEKPPARSANELLPIKNYLKEDLKLKYGFNHLYHDSVEKAAEIITSNRLGKIINLKGTYGKSFMNDWRSQKERSGGGILLDQGIHLLGIMKEFMGAHFEVKSFVSNSYWNYDVEDNVYALFRDEENKVGFLHSSATMWEHTFNLEINLENGKVILEGILSNSMSYAPEKIKIYYREDNTTEEFSYEKDQSWKKEIEEFSMCIIQNKKIEKGNFQDSLSLMKLVEKIYGAH